MDSRKVVAALPQQQLQQPTAGKKRTRADETCDSRLPFGIFCGTTIYRNRLHSGETFANGHVSLGNLLLPGTHSALITSFKRPDPDWLEEIFDDHVKNLVVVVHDARENGQACTVGAPETCPIATTESKRPGWEWIYAEPHTGGCLHSKLLLFRSAEGLRLVVSGNNFYKGQWKTDRDCMWVQDFDIDMGDGDYSDLFGARLRSFLVDLTYPHGLSKEIVHNIDFSPAEKKVRLVFSFPRQSNSKGADKGGYTHLAEAVDSFLSELDSGSNYGSDDEEQDDSQGSQDVSVGDTQDCAFAMSSSLGDVNPDFLLQMKLALQGKRDSSIPKHTPWEQVLDGIRCLWPSRETARTMPLESVKGSMRPMSAKHWANIPGEAKRRLFHDAVPHPREEGLPHLGCAAMAHAKVLFAVERGVGIVYVGSHNFSKAAWGLREGNPKNIEIGVVLATKTPRLQREWRDRLPYVLPSADKSPASYSPTGTVSEHDSNQGATKSFKDSNEKKSNGKKKNKVEAGASEKDGHVIDLCDSD